jgi:uncharacterized damage-inducible protein DinB
LRVADLRFLYDFDRWATRRLLDTAADAVDAPRAANGERAIGKRTLMPIVVHMLGAHERWRSAWADQPSPGSGSRERREGTPSLAQLREDWEAEWRLTDALFARLSDQRVGSPFAGPEAERDDRIPLWQMMVHVVNHGTQHRSEAAALLTELGMSPGDLDLIGYAESVVPT